MPNYLKNNFDELVRFKQVSRTSILNNMIEHFCRTEYALLQDDNRINELIMNVKKRNPKTTTLTPEQVSTIDEPISIPSFDDYNDFRL